MSKRWTLEANLDERRNLSNVGKNRYIYARKDGDLLCFSSIFGSLCLSTSMKCLDAVIWVVDRISSQTI